VRGVPHRSRAEQGLKQGVWHNIHSIWRRSAYGQAFASGNSLSARVRGRPLLFQLNLLSAAQPQPNAFGVVMAFVPSSALCRAALKGATSSPTEEVRSGSVPEQLEDKGLEASSNLRFLRSLSNIVLQRPHCGERTARGQTSRCRQIDQTHSPKILPNMIDFPLLLYNAPLWRCRVFPALAIGGSGVVTARCAADELVGGHSSLPWPVICLTSVSGSNP